MSVVESTKAQYRRTLKQRVKVRRYTGAGLNRPMFEVTCRASVTGYDPEKLVGSIQQGDRQAIVYADDLLGKGFALPLTSADKLVVRGKELAILAVDDNSRRVNDVLIAYELQVRG